MSPLTRRVRNVSNSVNGDPQSARPGEEWEAEYVMMAAAAYPSRQMSVATGHDYMRAPMLAWVEVRSSVQMKPMLTLYFRQILRLGRSQHT